MTNNIWLDLMDEARSAVADQVAEAAEVASKMFPVTASVEVIVTLDAGGSVYTNRNIVGRQVLALGDDDGDGDEGEDLREAS